MAKDRMKGRGAQLNSKNPYLQHELVQEHFEGLDEELFEQTATEYFIEHPKKFINKVDSPDLGLAYSMNPYQGCEHGCVYCYARNTHQYWGYSAGLDFERKIIVKPNAPEVLEKQLRNPKWDVHPIMLSGNTDCYQPAERKFKITRQILEICLKYRHPIAMITKNALVLRDLDVLRKLNEHQLVSVTVSITTLDEELRRALEPRTVSGKNRLKTVKSLSNVGIPVNVNIAPIIPGLNSSEIPDLARAAAQHGASSVAYIMVRLNGSIGQLFEDWIHKTLPDKATKVLNQIKEVHGGELNDSRWGTRMKGEGETAKSIAKLFSIARKKHFKNVEFPSLNCDAFLRAGKEQLKLF